MGEVNYAPLIDDMVWSYSRIKAFEDCPYRWYLKYIKRFHGKDMIKRTIKETVREYDVDGKVVRETVTETTEDDDTMYFPPFQTYQETVKPWWGEPSCTCKTNS